MHSDAAKMTSLFLIETADDQRYVTALREKVLDKVAEEREGFRTQDDFGPIRRHQHASGQVKGEATETIHASGWQGRRFDRFTPGCETTGRF